MRAKVSARQSCLAGTGIQPRLHRMIPAAMIAVIAALLSSGGLLMWVQITNSEPAAPLAAATVWSLCLAVSLSVLRLHPLSPAMVYLYVFGVFHLGLAVPWSMGLDVGPAPAWLLHSSLDPALTLIILALMAYLAGTSLAAWKWPVSERATPVDVRYHNVVIFHCGLVIFLGGLAMFLWGLRSLGFDRLLSATYFETYKLTNWYDPRFFVTSLNVAPIGLYLMAAAAPWRRIVAVLLTVLVWSSVIFWLGFRGFGLIPVITVLAVIHKRGFRLPKLAYPAGIAVMLFAIPLITVLRDARLEDRSIPEAASELRPLAAVSEMGASLRPLVHTVHYMETEDFRWGQTYWRGLLAVFPNVSGDWEGSSYLPLEELPPSHWVTKQAAPWSYAHFGGLGFSAVAEPYMNFGTAGVVLYFIALPAFLVGNSGFVVGERGFGPATALDTVDAPILKPSAFGRGWDLGACVNGGVEGRAGDAPLPPKWLITMGLRQKNRFNECKACGCEPASNHMSGFGFSATDSDSGRRAHGSHERARSARKGRKKHVSVLPRPNRSPWIVVEQNHNGIGKLMVPAFQIYANMNVINDL